MATLYALSSGDAPSDDDIVACMGSRHLLDTHQSEVAGKEMIWHIRCTRCRLQIIERYNFHGVKMAADYRYHPRWHELRLIGAGRDRAPYRERYIQALLTEARPARRRRKAS